jgi:hypothetical protein
MRRPRGLASRALRLGISRRLLLAEAPAVSPPSYLVNEAGDALVTDQGDTIGTERH